MLHTRLFLLGLLLCLGATPMLAQSPKGKPAAKPTAQTAKPSPGSSTSTPSGSTHPAAQAAVEYLKAIHLHEWEKAVRLVDGASLKNLQDFQYQYLQAAPTMPEEQALLKLLKLKNIEEIKALKPEEVFLRRGQAKTSKLANKEEYMKQMRSTLNVRALGSVVENDSLVHVVVRKEFTYKEKKVSELAFVSGVKTDAGWKVSLDAQEPEVTSTGSKANQP